MKKSENLILRIDPELKKIIDKNAEEKSTTTSELVRNILSVVFLGEYEDWKFFEFVKNEIKRNSDSLKNILDNPMIEKKPQLRDSIIENLEMCDEIMINLASKPNK